MDLSLQQQVQTLARQVAELASIVDKQQRQLDRQQSAILAIVDVLDASDDENDTRESCRSANTRAALTRRQPGRVPSVGAPSAKLPQWDSSPPPSYYRFKATRHLPSNATCIKPGEATSVPQLAKMLDQSTRLGRRGKTVSKSMHSALRRY